MMICFPSFREYELRAAQCRWHERIVETSQHRSDQGMVRVVDMETLEHTGVHRVVIQNR
jgi:hypothetical protein